MHQTHTPAILKAGWNRNSQIREEFSFTAGKVIVRGKLVLRGKQKRADYILYYKDNIPIAVIEAKDNKYSLGAGMQHFLQSNSGLLLRLKNLCMLLINWSFNGVIWKKIRLQKI